MKMKKYGIILLIVLALTVAAITIPAFATSGDVLYVKDGGTGDGSTPDAAMGDLFAAINALPADGGTVVVCGDLTITGSNKVAHTWTAKAGKVYVTGKYDGNDYKPTINFTGTGAKHHIDCASAIEFSYLTMNHTATGGSTEFYSGPDLTIGHGMTFLASGKPIETDPNGKICFRAGSYDSIGINQDSRMEFYSGRFSYIHGGSRWQTAADTTIIVHPDVTLMDHIQLGGTLQGINNVTCTIDGADVEHIYVGGYGTAGTISGNIKLTLKNGTFPDLLGHRSQSTTVGGNLNLTLDAAYIESWDNLLKNLSFTGTKNLTVKNATDFKVSDSLEGWDSLKLENATVWVDAAYKGPSTFTADADSLLIVDDSTSPVPDGALKESVAVVTVDGTNVADLKAAYGALPAQGGIIRLATDITITLDTTGTTEYYAWPGYFYSGTAKTGPVTITSADPADPAVLKLVSYRTTRSVFSFRGVTKFSNLELRVHQNSTGGVQLFAGPSLTFGQGMTCTNNDGAAITKADVLGIRLGDHNQATKYQNMDSKFYMYSGTVNFIQGGSDRNPVGTSTIYVGKDATVVHILQCGGTKMPVATANVTVEGATINELYLNGHGAGATMGTVNLTVRNATVGSIGYHRTADAGATCTTANVTLDNSTIGTNNIIAKDSRIATGSLTLSNYNYLSVAGSLSGWNTLTLDNSVVHVIGSKYEGPTTVTADASSVILLDSEQYTELPTIDGVRTVFANLVHIHSMTYTAAKAPGVFSTGNNAYYKCSSCGKFYADAEGETELDYDKDIHLAALGSAGLHHHNYVDGKNFSLETIFSGGTSQGVAVYGDLLFKATNAGTCTVWDLTTGQQVGASFDFGSVSRDEDGKTYNSGATANHSNSIMFGPAKFDENDPFPLLYVCAGNSGDHIVKSTGLDGTDLWGTDTEGSYYGHLAIERIFYDETTGKFSSETVQRVFFNDMANIPVVEGDNLQANLLSTMRDSTTGALYYTDGNGYDDAKGYQKIGWGWPAWFVDSDPTSETAGKLFIFSVRYRTYSSYEATNRNFYKLGSDWNYFLEDGTGNAYIFTELDMPALPTSKDDPNYGKNVILYPKDIKDQFTTLYTNGGTQGGTMYQGRIYYSYGFGEPVTNRHSRNYINVFDIAKRDIIAEVPLCNDPTTQTHEPECPAIWNGELIISMNPGVYSLGYIALDEPAVQEPTCTVDGKTYIECSLCGHNLKTLSTSQAGGHKLDNIYKNNSATVTVKDLLDSAMNREGEEPGNLFDGKDSSYHKWCAPENGSWVGFQTEKPIILKEYTICNSDESKLRITGAWRLQYLNPAVLTEAEYQAMSETEKRAVLADESYWLNLDQVTGNETRKVTRTIAEENWVLAQVYRLVIDQREQEDHDQWPACRVQELILTAVTTEEPTCEKEGTYYVSCVSCGVVEAKKEDILNHAYMFACDAHCMNCGEKTRPDAKHSVKHAEAVTPTDCGEMGNVEYWYCEHCGSVWTDEELTQVSNRMNVVVFKDHELAHVEAKPATEEADGNIEHWFCSACGKYYADAAGTQELSEKEVVLVYIPATGDRAMLIPVALLALLGLTGAILLITKKKYF